MLRLHAPARQELLNVAPTKPQRPAHLVKGQVAPLHEPVRARPRNAQRTRQLTDRQELDFGPRATGAKVDTHIQLLKGNRWATVPL